MAQVGRAGYFNQYAIPGNLASLGVFRDRVRALCWRTIRRRSQKRRSSGRIRVNGFGIHANERYAGTEYRVILRAYDCDAYQDEREEFHAARTFPLVSGRRNAATAMVA
jgi:hypothetical protein